MTKMREIIDASWGKYCRQILARSEMVTVIGQFTADSRVEPKSNAHLPISADDRVDIWYTPTD